MGVLAWVGRSYLLVAGTAVLGLFGLFLLLCAAGLVQDVAKDLRERRARRRFSREALEQARARLAAQRQRRAVLEAQARAAAAEQELLWREIVAFPEYPADGPTLGAGR